MIDHAPLGIRYFRADLLLQLLDSIGQGAYLSCHITPGHPRSILTQLQRSLSFCKCLECMINTLKFSLKILDLAAKSSGNPISAAKAARTACSKYS